MSLLNNKKNNSGIRQLNQIDNIINNVNNKPKPKIENNIQKNKEIIGDENNEEEEEEEEEEEGDDDNINEEEYIEENEDENNEEEEDDENLSILDSYRYKLNYVDNINFFPRLKTNCILYKNSKNENNFVSNPNNQEEIPSIRSDYINIEDLNSSIKLIRPSQYIIPYNYSNYKKSLNLFGINVEPFAIDEKQNNIEFIQKINIHIKNKYNKNILRCEHCNLFYHKYCCNYEAMSNNGIYQTNKLQCYICKKNSHFYTIDTPSNYSFEKEIFPEKIFLVPNVDCNKPSIEYIIKYENEIDNLISINTIQIIVLDLSNKNFTNFIYQTLIKILNKKEENSEYNDDINNKFKYIFIAYDINKVYFIYFNNKKNKYINISIMNDFKNPFCPVDPKKLICEKNSFIELLDIFYNTFLLSKYNNNDNSFSFFDINNSVIKSIFSLIKSNNINQNIKIYYHIIFITSLHHNIDINILEQNRTYKAFLSFFLVLNKSNTNIPFINNLKITNAKLYYYPVQYDEPEDKEQKYQKIENDLTSLITNYKNYIYEIKMNICYDKNIFQNYLNNDNIYISFIPDKSQFNKLYILPQYKKPNLKESVYFQYNIEYYNIFDYNKHIRILNFINRISDNQIEVFKAYDEEVLFRIVLANHIRELNLEKNNFASINKLFLDIVNKKDKIFLKIITNIQNQIKRNLAKNYRFGEEKNNIYTPISCKYFPLYFYSFIKQISNGEYLNLLNLLYDGPIITFMKSVYPNLLNLGYKVSKKEEIFSLHPLTLLYLEKNQLLLLDDGQYIILLINNEINKRKKEHFFQNFDETKKKGIFYSESPILNNIIGNKPIKKIFLNDENILNKSILTIFLEDIIIKNMDSEPQYTKSIENANEYIQNDIGYPNYYEILSGNLYEFLE